MSKLIPVLLLATALAVPTMAFAWWVTPVSYNPHQVSVVVSNRDSGWPVHCSGAVYGTTYAGFTIESRLNNWTLYPGQARHVGVVSPPGNPFVNGWTDIYCN